MNNVVKEVKLGQEVILKFVNSCVQKLGAFLPTLLGAIFILILGWLIAKLFKKIAKKIFKAIGINYFTEKSGINELFQKLGTTTKAEDFLASLVYLVVLLIFIVSATEVLGIRIVIETLDKFIVYIPKIFGAIFIFAFLSYIGKFIGHSITNLLEASKVEFAGITGKTVNVIVVLFAFVISLKELGFETTILTANITIISGISLATIGIAVGLGGQQIARKVVAGFYLKNHLEIGQEINIGEIKGKIKSFGTTSIVIENEGEELLIPNDKIMDNIVKILK